MKNACIPDWAWQRAADLAAERLTDTTKSFDAKWVKVTYTGQALAAYIAEHEEPPVDPDLVRAREICAEVATYRNDKAGYLNGSYDGTLSMRATLKALKENKK